MRDTQLQRRRLDRNELVPVTSIPTGTPTCESPHEHFHVIVQTVKDYQKSLSIQQGDVSTSRIPH
jgi:hypothetical protein